MDIDLWQGAFTGTPDKCRDRPEAGCTAIPDVLPAQSFRELLAGIEGLSGTERSFVPTHKKGGTIAFDTLKAEAPALVASYRTVFRELASRVTGLALLPTPEHDQSSCSLLRYERPGDHIGWHYDHNFYRGRHFTALYTLLNEGRQAGTLSAARLMVREDGVDVSVPTPPNAFVLFEGARVLHKVTPIAEGERRTVLSMTYCTDPRNSRLQGIARRIKDMAFFGPRALWT